MGDLRIERSGHIVTVTIDRPPVNALTLSTYAEIRDIFTAFSDDHTTRAVIFTGSGSRAFCAGVDLKALDQRPETIESIERRIDPGLSAREAFRAVYECAVPVIAAVNGPALGAGLALVAVCDLIIAADTATFGAPEINAGVLGASAHMSLLVGRHKMRELFFLGEPMTAMDLHEAGVVSAVVEASDLLAVANSFAERLSEKSPIAMRLAKEALNRVEFLPLWDAYRVEQDYTNRLLTFEDSAEARRAFLEKRKPEWKIS